MRSTVIATAALVAASLGPARPPTHPSPSALSNFSTTHTIRYSRDSTNSDVTGEEREFMERVNVERAERGLYALTPDLQLVQAARAHSYDMYARNYFSHVAPAGPLRSPMDRYLFHLRSEGFPTPNHLTIGENIFYCSAKSDGSDVAFADQVFMNSPEHRANILNPNFDRIGVGIWRDAKGELWVTEEFLQDSD